MLKKRDDQRRNYEPPRVSTIDARELLEALGPVSCYGGAPTMPAQMDPTNSRLDAKRF